MSHDLYASWVTAELSSMFKKDSEILFEGIGLPSNNVSCFANRESGRSWPIPDGRISVYIDSFEIEVALELKRTNEGLHGVLTATGQAQAYLKKGYDISVIAVPNEYDSYSDPGSYLADLLNSIDRNSNIIVVTYSVPDETKASPFKGKLNFHRTISFDPKEFSKNKKREFGRQKASNQWAHLREGSSDADCFFRYLQTAKNISANENYKENFNINLNLTSACKIISPNISAERYLSYSYGDTLHDKVWRKYWFDYILTIEMQNIWTDSTSKLKEIGASYSKLKVDSVTFKQFFGGRSDSVKNKIVSALNIGSSATELMAKANSECRKKIEKLNESGELNIEQLTAEEMAWIIFAINIHGRAHSFREDIDSGLSHIGMLEDDGRPTNLGYKFVDMSERTGDCYSRKSFQIYGSAILNEGQLSSFLHYFHRISDEVFSVDPLFSSSKKIVQGKLKFLPEQYLQFVRAKMIDELCVINTAAERSDASRKPFQAEFALLYKLGIIQPKKFRFRLGVGLIINWPRLADYLES